MAYESKIIVKEDFDNNQNYKNALDNIHRTNQVFYDQFINVLNYKPDFRISEKVFYFMADDGCRMLNDTFGFISREDERNNLKQDLYANLFKIYFKESYFTAEWIAWIITYFTEDNSEYKHYELDDFNVVMNDVAINRYPLDVTKRKFREESDLIRLADFFSEPYTGESGAEGEFGTNKEKKSESENVSKDNYKNSSDERNDLRDSDSPSADDKKVLSERKKGGLSLSDDHGNDFMSLLNTLFSDTKDLIEVETPDPVDNLSTKFNRISGTLQQSVTDLTGCVTDIFREWEKDRAQIEKLSNLFKVVQKIDLSYKENLRKKDEYIGELEAKIAKLESEVVEDKKIQGLLGELAKYHHDDNKSS